MRYRIIDVCRKCGNIHYKNISKKQRIVERILLISFCCSFLFAFIGLLTVVKFFYIVDVKNIGSLIEGGHFSTVVDMSNMLIPKKDMQILERYAIQVTSPCNNDTYCKIKTLRTHLRQNWKYEDGQDQNPIHIFNEKTGDCDEVNNLYVILLKSINITAYLDCTTEHCKTVIHMGNETISLDATPFITGGAR